MGNARVYPSARWSYPGCMGSTLTHHGWRLKGGAKQPPLSKTPGGGDMGSERTAAASCAPGVGAVPGRNGHDRV